jgi:hypothetical protein
VDQGALDQGGSSLYVQPLATATASANFGGPNTLRALNSYWNGTAPAGGDFDLRPDIVSGTNPAWDGWHFFHNGGPAGQKHHIYVDPTMDFAIAHNDGSFSTIVAAVTGNGADQVFTLPVASGAQTLAIFTPLVAVAPQTSAPLSSTSYMYPGGTVNFGTSTNRQIAFPRSGTISHMYVCTGSAQSSTGSLVFTFQTGTYNAALTNTSLAVTFAANAAAGCIADNTDSFAYMAGQGIDVVVVNNATVASAVFTIVYAEFSGVS